MKINYWQKLLILFAAWLGVIFLLGAVVIAREPVAFAPTYPGWEVLERSDLPGWLARLNAFDGFHYQTIAAGGYEQGIDLIQAFFPLYPLLIAGVGMVGVERLLASILLSAGATLGWILIGHKYFGEKFGEKISAWILIVMLTLPASFFFAAGYNEALFVLLLLAALWSYERRKFYLVGIFCLLLSATRLVGVILPVVLLIDYLGRFFWLRWQKGLGQEKLRRWGKQDWVNVLCLAGGGLGLLAYMFYLGINFGDPLYFMSVQSEFGSGRQTSTLVLWPQTVYRYMRIFIVGLPLDIKFFQILQEFVISLFYAGALLFTAWQNWRSKKEIYPWTWWLFSAGAYLIPTLTGTFSSMPRYTLVCLIGPLFLARIFAQRRWCGWLFCGLSFCLMLINLALFLQGYFVA